MAIIGQWSQRRSSRNLQYAMEGTMHRGARYDHSRIFARLVRRVDYRGVDFGANHGLGRAPVAVGSRP